jgi:uncharacterized protein (TIGR02646 family)
MKPIKGLVAPPDQLRRYCNDPAKAQTWAAFRRDGEGRRAYDDLSAALVEAQRGLCCYCEITLIVPDDRQIEHVRSRDRFPQQALDVTNMLAGCQGGSKPSLASDPNRFTRPAKPNLSCGQKKGVADTLDPRRLPSDVSVFVVTDDGRMLVAAEACTANGISADEAKNALLDLGLQAPRLIAARKKIMQALAADNGAPSAENEHFARGELLPDGQGKIPPWFTTRRSYFGAIAEKILAEPPQDWIGM